MIGDYYTKSSTFNPPLTITQLNVCVIIFTSHYNWIMVLLQYLKRNDIPKLFLTSKLNSISQCQLQQVNEHHMKSVGDEL